MNHCENEPYHPFSIWKCHWSNKNKIKICRKKCQKNYQLTTADNKLTCSYEDGWENKAIAECIEGHSQESLAKKFTFIRYFEFNFFK